MEQIKELFVNWQLILVAFGSFILVSIIRSAGTRKDVDGKVTGGYAQNKWFLSFVPLYPYILAILLTFLLPLPKMVVELGKKGIVVKILFGCVAGWLSSYSFQLVKKILENAFNMKFDPEPAEAKPIVPVAAKPVEPAK
jgi:hypothetical protein